MKTLLLSVIAIIALNLSNAQDAKYVKAMEKNIALLDSASKGSASASFQDAYNGFERIANANPKEWLPLYYQSFCEVMMGMKQTENIKKDEYYDKAEALINRADSVKPDNSEIYVMKSFVTSMQLSVDPQSRGQKLGMKSGMLLNKAIQLDPENPRAYYLKGQGLMFTPPQWGGGKEKAIPVLETAVEKFSKFKPSNTIVPNWGEARAKAALEEAKKPE
jgi:tetratricopeptide (TPR) repeat protein